MTTNPTRCFALSTTFNDVDNESKLHSKIHIEGVPLAQINFTIPEMVTNIGEMELDEDNAMTAFMLACEAMIEVPTSYLWHLCEEGQHDGGSQTVDEKMEAIGTVLDDYDTTPNDIEIILSMIEDIAQQMDTHGTLKDLIFDVALEETAHTVQTRVTLHEPTDTGIVSLLICNNGNENV